MLLRLPATPSGLVQLPLQPRQAFQTGSSKHTAACLVAATRHTYTLRRTSLLQHPSGSQHSSPALSAHPCDTNCQFVNDYCITWRGDSGIPGTTLEKKSGAFSLCEDSGVIWKIRNILYSRKLHAIIMVSWQCPRT